MGSDPRLPETLPSIEPRAQHSPLRLARATTSAAPLLITLVTYRGQLACLAMVMARNTASASTWGQGGSGKHRPPDQSGHGRPMIPHRSWAQRGQPWVGEDPCSSQGLATPPSQPRVPGLE